MRFRNHAIRLFAAVLIVAAGVTPVYADIYGSVSGVVRDSGGSPLPGVTVTIAGPTMPAGRQSITESGGDFRFQTLQPGKYTVTAELAGLGRSKADVSVSVDKDTQVQLTLSPAVAESITVTAATPAVDTKATEINYNFEGEVIEDLPLQRSYSGLLQLAPGVAENNSFAGGVNAGGSRQDNTYLLDGVNITNPFFGYLSTESNDLDIKDFNIKRGGYTAEFGRSAGMVTNAVTKSGTNDLEGTVRFEYQPKEFTSETRTGVEEALDRMIPAFAVGGPIIRDRVFGYGSGRFYRGQRADRVNRLGPVPDEDISTDEFFGKISAYPTMSQLLEVGYRHRPTTDEFASVGATESPSVATNNETLNRVVTAHYSWTIANNTLLEGKYLHMDEDNDTVAVTQLAPRGTTFNVANVAAMGYFNDPTIPRLNPTGPTDRGGFVGGASLASSRGLNSRDEVRLSVGRFFDLAGMSHEVKVGGGWDEGSEELTRVSNGWGIITLVQNGTQYAASYYPDQPSQLGTGLTYSLFVQDQVSIGSRLVVNVGVLANRDEFSQTTDEERTFLKFGFSDEIQPRIGATYNLRNVGDKIYANYGRYYNMDQKSTARSLAPRRLFTNDALFNATTGALISDRPNSATVSKNISPDIEPTYTDEFLVGYATPLGSRWSVESSFLYRTTKDFIEDFPTVAPGSSFLYDNIGAYRKYYALVTDLRRTFSDRWMVDVNYTWSRLYGNYDQDYYAAYGDLTATGAVFNTSSALNDGPGTFFSDPNRDGPLALDRTHVFKAFGTMQVINNLSLGGYLRVQSGTPWEDRGRDWTNRFIHYLEPAGANRNPWWANFDLNANYRLPVGRFGVEFEARVLNLFDTQTTIRTDPRPYLDGRIRTTEPPYFQQGTTQPNPDYGKGVEFAPPRRFILSVKVDF